VVQQGMSDDTGLARRYHWLDERAANPVLEPHAAVCCDVQRPTLNLVAAESRPAQDAMVELTATADRDLTSLFDRLPTLDLPARHQVHRQDLDSRYLKKMLLRTYEAAPRDFQQLLGIDGMGPKTVRALALAAELIYGTPVSTRDPARFAFAHGGKDGTPYPVDRSTYEQTIEVLHQALDRAKVDRSEKVRALKRLASFACEANGPVL
jgi:hypothetical protein